MVRYFFSVLLEASGILFFACMALTPRVCFSSDIATVDTQNHAGNDLSELEQQPPTEKIPPSWLPRSASELSAIENHHRGYAVMSLTAQAASLTILAPQTLCLMSMLMSSSDHDLGSIVTAMSGTAVVFLLSTLATIELTLRPVQKFVAPKVHAAASIVASTVINRAATAAHHLSPIYQRISSNGHRGSWSLRKKR